MRRKVAGLSVTRSARSAPMAVLTLSLLAGCGGSDGLPREALSGAITMDGAPVSRGWIEFRPKDAGAVTTTAAPIQEGRYNVVQSEGLVPGSYVVSITAGGAPEAPQIPAPVDRVPPPPPEPIPSRYNVETSLGVDVKPGGMNTFDFALDSK